MPKHKDDNTILQIIHKQLIPYHHLTYKLYTPYAARNWLEISTIYPPLRICRLVVVNPEVVIWPTNVSISYPVRIPIAHPHLTKLIINTILNLSCAQHCTVEGDESCDEGAPLGPEGGCEECGEDVGDGGY